MTSQNSDPSVGDVFVFPIERIGKFGAVQVVEVGADGRRVSAAVLDWVGEQPPASVAELAGVGRMARTFFRWDRDEMLQGGDWPFPAGYVRIGTLPVHGETECGLRGTWGFEDDVTIQLWWQALPAELTVAFKEAGGSGRVMTTPGLVCERTGELFRLPVSDTFFSDDADYRVTDEFRMESLRAWPRLYEVRLGAWRDDLVPFLESSPLVIDLELEGHGRRVLDLSRTHLQDLTIDLTGLERLVLPDSLDMLHLHGAAPEDLVVEAARAGRWISVYEPYGALARVRGLENAEAVFLQGIGELSVGDLVQHHPNVRSLQLFGLPGVLHDVQDLARLPELETIFFVDLFGFSADDFPGPAQLPSLRSLELSSTPAEVATWVRAAFKKVPGIGLRVSRPRKPEWLQENIGNPLRGWEGRDGIPATAAKKTSSAWRAALKITRATDDDAAIVAAVTEFLAIVQGLNAKRGFIFTLERDEVVDAVHLLTTHLSEAGRRTLDPLVEEALD